MHSIHHRLNFSPPCFLFLSLIICFQQETACSCSERSPDSPGNLCPGGRHRECVALIRGDRWKAGCHGTASPGLHSQYAPIFQAVYIITAMIGVNTERREEQLPADSHILAERDGPSTQHGGMLVGAARCLIFSPILCLCVLSAGF